jgi:hypothetical protein
MRISIHGNDEGGAMLLSLVAILVFSLLFVSLVPRVSALNRAAKQYKAEVISRLQKENQEIITAYDLN